MCDLICKESFALKEVKGFRLLLHIKEFVLCSTLPKKVGATKVPAIFDSHIYTSVRHNKRLKNFHFLVCVCLSCLFFHMFGSKFELSCPPSLWRKLFDTMLTFSLLSFKILLPRVVVEGESLANITLAQLPASLLPDLKEMYRSIRLRMRHEC